MEICACFCIETISTSVKPVYPLNIKSTQLDERLALITEPNILQVSLVNINDNFTVMTKVSVFKHPLIVHPIDAHYLSNRVLLTDIGRTENGITI